MKKQATSLWLAFELLDDTTYLHESSTFHDVSPEKPTFWRMIGYIQCERSFYHFGSGMDEQKAIQQLKRGDIDGLEALVNSYQLKAVRAAYLITRDPHLAEDVAQESFLAAYRSIGGFDASRPFEPWFMRSVIRAAVKAAQKTAKQVPVDSEEPWAEEWLREQESVEAQVESAEFQQKLWDAMQQLAPRQRAVIVQRYYLEMSEKEMAAELQTAPGTVKWLLNAARERLRALLGSERSVR